MEAGLSQEGSGESGRPVLRPAAFGSGFGMSGPADLGDLRLLLRTRDGKDQRRALTSAFKAPFHPPPPPTAASSEGGAREPTAPPLRAAGPGR